MKGEVLVIGSGPAGVSAAHGLLARGRRVRMIDVGETLEPEGEARRARMGSVEPYAWAAADVEAVTHPRRKNRAGVMLPFGSDFQVRDTPGFFGADGPPRDLALRPSFAFGGLSNGWGASVLPSRIEDIATWPAASRDLAPHYKAVAGFMPIAADVDELSDQFPLWNNRSITGRFENPQANTLFERLSPRRERLRRQGIRFGRARTAYDAAACRACGLCLFGCPYKLIFNAADAVADLRRRDDFTYESGWCAIRFEETEPGARVFVRRVDTLDSTVMDCDRLFLAAGVLPTARIVLNSGGSGASLTLHDSPHALMPMLHLWRPPRDLEIRPHTTFAQIFAEMTDAAISPYTVHTQIYAFNRLYAEDLRLKFGSVAVALGPLVKALSRRLMVAQLFTHSDHGGRIEVRLDGPLGDARLAFGVRSNPEAAGVLRRGAAKLARALLPVGVVALLSQMRLEPVGSSFHVGGSLPMRENPARNETDVFGRPPGLRRVHVVDASVFPSVPATTITFTVMANAHRIAATTPS